jgi:hypothetical protein
VPGLPRLAFSLSMAKKPIFRYTVMMPLPTLKTAKKFLGWTTIGLFALCVFLLKDHLMNLDEVKAYLVRTQIKSPPWETISDEEVMSGAVIPADTNVIFHLPESFTTITRETLFGWKGKRTRYWGYCFPANYDPKNVSVRNGFPGLIFLSEKERAVRAEAERNRKPEFTISHPPTTEAQVERANSRPLFPIRHQLEVFKPSTMCYIMTEDALAIGLDQDSDRLNNKLERELGTDPKTPDSDGDGVSDGVEFKSGMVPSARDSDGDGVIDGIEDSDWDGRIDIGETNPLNIDSDRDNICDGMCRVRVQRQYIYLGEDKNLNGTVDENETDPNKFDSDGDGIGDEVEHLRCLAQGNTDCP